MQKELFVLLIVIKYEASFLAGILGINYVQTIYANNSDALDEFTFLNTSSFVFNKAYA